MIAHWRYPIGSTNLWILGSIEHSLRVLSILRILRRLALQITQRSVKKSWLLAKKQILLRSVMDRLSTAITWVDRDSLLARHCTTSLIIALPDILVAQSIWISTTLLVVYDIPIVAHTFDWNIFHHLQAIVSLWAHSLRFFIAMARSRSCTWVNWCIFCSTWQLLFAIISHIFGNSSCSIYWWRSFIRWVEFEPASCTHFRVQTVPLVLRLHERAIMDHILLIGYFWVFWVSDVLAFPSIFLCHVPTVEDRSSFAFLPLILQLCGAMALDHDIIAGTFIVLHHRCLSTVVQVDLLRIYSVTHLVDGQMNRRCRNFLMFVVL